MMNKKEALHLAKLEKMLEAEKERSEKVWSAYRDTLYELVDLRLKLERINNVLRGEE